MDRRHFLAAASSASMLGLGACGGSSDAAPPPPPPPPPPPAGPDWASLQAGIQGSVVLPGAAAYALAAPVFNAVYDATQPQAVVRCAGAGDVAAALAFARANKLSVTARSGGHGYTGNATTTGMVIDVGAMNAIAVGNGTATIGAGAKLVDVYDQLSAQGVCIPSGSCPTIGIAGITQGGGIGVLDRAYGLTCDHLVSAQVVLADGSVVTCDAGTHADLFWALRGGGGGNFGIVTSLTFDTFATSDLTSLSASFAWTDAAAVIAAWQAWPLTLPDTVWSGMVLQTTQAGSPAIEVSGTFIGSSADFAPIWASFLAASGATPTSQSVQTQPFRDTMLASCGGRTVSQCHLASETSDGNVPRGAFVATSDFFDAALPTAGIQALLAAVQAQQAIAPLIVIMDLMGGAIARVAPDATAFVHRSAVFSAQYYMDGPVGTPDAQIQAARGIVTGMRTAMAAWSSGECYQNYLDPQLANWPAAYYGANYARLVQVKAAYDPTQVFRPAQGIPPQ
ncbi:FAD-binding oxidoreductase [Scleromatobacter humisilvae]|uniref:FAD-binding oxidoreductase n=1 Tax=Scleromatobacter humisilvae TaxID=2897159 RepID=A0A9X1YI67_9BURK|nr:FAD-binding oxidoreductase [Scleromatobacter humisilvae]MCK9686949.1 FAD-binding oxidoreductase [Scleromatobacter humisilvae]